MNMSHLQLIWANIPACGKTVAEVWIGERDLWFTIFADDNDKTLKVDVPQTTAVRRRISINGYLLRMPKV